MKIQTLGRAAFVFSVSVSLGVTGCSQPASEVGEEPAPGADSTPAATDQTDMDLDPVASSGSATATATTPGASETGEPATSDGPAAGSSTGAPPSAMPSETNTSQTDPMAPTAGAPTGSNSSPAGPDPSSTEPAPLPTAPAADDPASIAPGSGPLGQETTCDGNDDDSNGVIDDVDAAGDGVCDCLAIATLGLHGEWGSGDVLQGWLGERSATPVVALEDAELTADLLAPYQVLIIRDVSAMHNEGLSYSAAEAQVLWDWVREGGGLMTLIGYSDAGEINNVNVLLEGFSLGYSEEQVVAGNSAAVPIEQFFEHPVSAGVMQVGADNGYPTLGQGTTVASQDGYDMGKAAVIGDGHVLVWGDEWVTYEDEWRDDTTYQVERFWLNTLDWLARANECHVPQP